MANSQQLSKIHLRDGGGRSINNQAAKDLEGKLKDAVQEVLSVLQKRYPNYSISHHTNILKRKWHNWDFLKGLKGFEEFGTYREIENCSFKPDGGIITATINEKTYVIYVGEAKNQGEGKKQASGNAVERSYKNVQEVRMLMKMSGADYLPYVLFCSGHDFKPGSSILDRLTALTWSSPFNRIYCENVEGFERVSVFARLDRWTHEEMVDVSLKMCERSISWITSRTN